MTIFVEVVSEKLEVSYSDVPQQRYLTDMPALICDAASECYRRGERRRWFADVRRPTLMFMNGRPC